MSTPHITDKEILANVTLHLPDGKLSSAEGLLAETLSTLFTGTGTKFCFAVWDDGPLKACIPFPTTQKRPTPETIVAIYREGKKLPLGSCGEVPLPEQHVKGSK